ncbi:MAG: TIGR03643 family protein [Bdellovibrionales bacterium]|nr:TIGR03643 family protein [Bdellovibrionales bacterium]
MKNKIKSILESFSQEECDRFIRMCWEDRTPFEAIQEQFNLNPNDAVKCMRMILDAKDFKRWRQRANNLGHLKHLKTRPAEVNRFKCSRQNLDGSTKGYK